MEDREFYELILDPKTRKRDRNYAIWYGGGLVVYIALVLICHFSFPNGRIAGVPVFCLLTWLITGIQFFYSCMYKGYRNLWPKKDK